MKQAAMYVRVSTSQQQDEGTIESQKAALLKFAKTKGFEINQKFVFEDNGVSGSTLVRHSLDKLRDYASEGLFDHLFVLSPDRLARKYAYQVLLLEEFKKQGINVIFHNSSNQNTPEETMLLQMQGMFAEYERAQITERTRRGKKFKAKNGAVSVLTKGSYGYRYIRTPLENRAYLEIHDKEAGVVRTIFKLYVKDRLSIGEIKLYLERHKIFTPKGFTIWDSKSISSILKNTSYKGIAYYGKTERCESNPMRLPSRVVRLSPGPRTPKKSFCLRDRSEWIGIPVPAIVAEETFEIAQELFKRNIKLSPRNTREPTLLQGLMSCKECGYSFKKTRSGGNPKKYFYYSCHRKGSKCTNRSIRLKALDESIWKSLTSMLVNPELIKNEISRRIEEIKNEPLELKQRQQEKKIVNLENEIDRLLDAYQAGHIEIEELGKRTSALKREMNTLKREMTEAGSGLSKEQLLEITVAIEHFSSQLKKAQDNISVDEKRKVLRMLIKEIRVGKDSIEINHIIPINQIQGEEKLRVCVADV